MFQIILYIIVRIQHLLCDFWHKGNLCIIALTIFFFPSLFSKNPSSKVEVLEGLTRANSYFMKKWPDPGKSIIAKNKILPSNIWTRAVYFEGLMSFYKINPQKSYFDYALKWGEAHNWSLRGGIETTNADNQCCGQTYIQLYQIVKRPEMIKDIKASIDLMKISDKKDYWTWIDAMQMSMPLFAQLAVLYNDDNYYEKMYEMYMYSKTVLGGSGLYNPNDNLWWRDKDFIHPYLDYNEKNCYWSRGNGWMTAALVRILDIMSKQAPHRDEYEKTLKEMLGALIPLQRPDGYWNVNLKDPTNFGGKELTGTALFIYGMAWGVNNGILDKNIYLPVIYKAWDSMMKNSLHANGFLGYVQGTGKQPSDSQPVGYNTKPDFEDYGLGCFLLAGTEVYKLSK